MLKGLSLLELIVVMAITAVLMVTGTVFLLSYQRNVQLHSAYTYIVSSVKIMQNKANNSTSLIDGGNRVTPDIFALRFNNGQMTTYYCNFPGAVPGSVIHCDPYADSGIDPVDSNYNVDVTSNCFGIGFGRLTGDVYRLDATTFTGTGTIISDSPTPNCAVTLTHNDSGDTRVMNININSNNLNL